MSPNSHTYHGEGKDFLLDVCDPGNLRVNLVLEATVQQGTSTSHLSLWLEYARYVFAGVMLVTFLVSDCKRFLLLSRVSLLLMLLFIIV